MAREIILTEEEKQLSEDIQYLLSSIRARENSLIFFLEHFSSSSGLDQPHEFRMYKNQFLQKERIYTSQVNDVLTKHQHAQFDTSHHLLRSFWLKLKSILKVSLQRIKILDLLNDRIFQRYETIITLINTNYDHYKGLEGLKQVENCLKKRNIDALIIGKNHVLEHSDSKISKNKSQKFLKSSDLLQKHQSQMQTPPTMKLRAGLGALNPEKQQQNHPRLKSLNRYNTKPKRIMQKFQRKTISNKAGQKHFKKFTKNIEKYQKNLQGVMDGKLDVNFDKKKTIFQNVYSIYDSLFDKNISNHKCISKYIFTSCGLNNIICQKKMNRKLKNAKQNKKQQKQVKQARTSSRFNKSKKRIEQSDTQKRGFEPEKNYKDLCGINKNHRSIKSSKLSKKSPMFGGQTLNTNHRQLLTTSKIM